MTIRERIKVEYSSATGNFHKSIEEFDDFDGNAPPAPKKKVFNGATGNWETP